MTSRTAMPVLGPNPSTTEIDQVVHALIDLHFAGEIDEKTVRKEISGAIYASGIHTDVADRRTDLTQQGRTDLAEMLLGLITDKVINGNYYSLDLGRQKSVCGWARQMAKSAVESELRKVRRASNRNGTPVDPTSHEFTAVAVQAPSLIVVDAYSAHVDSSLGDLVEDFTERSKGMRETDRVVASAETLCIGLGVAPALRPDDMDDRDFCFKELTADETLAYRSLRAWSNLVHGSDPDAVDDVDDRLLGLWDEQTEDSTTELLSRPDYVAHMLAIAAVSPMPRPPKKALQKIKTVTMGAAPVSDKVWRELASTLVDAYVASEFEAVSQYATVSVEAKKASMTGHHISRSRLSALLDRAASHPGSPLGKNPKQILDRVSATAQAVLAEETAPKQTRAASKQTLRAV